jgi:hypothetical protein
MSRRVRAPRVAIVISTALILAPVAPAAAPNVGDQITNPDTGQPEQIVGFAPDGQAITLEGNGIFFSSQIGVTETTQGGVAYRRAVIGPVAGLTGTQATVTEISPPAGDPARILRQPAVVAADPGSTIPANPTPDAPGGVDTLPPPAGADGRNGGGMRVSGVTIGVDTEPGEPAKPAKPGSVGPRLDRTIPAVTISNGGIPSLPGVTVVSRGGAGGEGAIPSCRSACPPSKAAPAGRAASWT